jgi:hypothetical protein
VKHANGDSTVLKYNEPPEARKPVLGWRLYVFKGTEQVGERCRVAIPQTPVDIFWFVN